MFAMKYYYSQYTAIVFVQQQSPQVALSRMDRGRGIRADDIEATPSNPYGKVGEHAIQAI